MPNDNMTCVAYADLYVLARDFQIWGLCLRNRRYYNENNTKVRLLYPSLASPRLVSQTSGE